MYILAVAEDIRQIISLLPEVAATDYIKISTKFRFSTVAPEPSLGCISGLVHVYAWDK